MRVLLVADDHLALEGLTQMLRWERFHGELVGCATDGQEALRLVAEQRPQIVISDIKMPIMDGLELTRCLYEKYPGIRMILISGHGEFEYARQALQYQVVDYLLKPITRQKLTVLENRLVEIDSRLRDQREDFGYLYDRAFRDRVLTALRRGDMTWLGEMLLSEQVHQALASDNHGALGVQLLSLLFTYQEEIGKDLPQLEVLKRDAIDEYWRRASVDDRVTFLAAKYYDLMEYAENRKSEYAESIAAECLRMVDREFTDPGFNVSRLADSLNLSLPYVSTVFKQSTGKNLSAYLAAKRLERARELLCDLSIPIREVCARSGYEDPKYFAKSFKKRMGMTPSEYRNLYSGSQPPREASV